MRQKFAWVIVATLLSCSVGLAQSTLGTLLGTVTDPSGGVVPNATVRITNVDENTTRTFTTNTGGNYEATNSKPGNYKIEVTCPGFQTSLTENIQLTARQTLRVDVALRLGEVSQQVEVTGQAAGVITTETETVASTYQSLQITNLPTNFRASGNGNSPYLLLSVLPGIQSDSGGSLSIQGGLQNQSQFSVDGISTTDVSGNQPLRNAFPSADSLAEIKVQGVGSPAEFGAPGDVTVVSKSGTNDLHGHVFWYHQNAALDAIPYGASSKPAKVANDFGGSAGGPVVIPHLYNGKNKSFFFGTYERFHLPRTGVVQNTVPTQAMRNGDESYLCSSGFDSSGVCTDRDGSGNVIGQIYDPLTGQPFAHNQIPAINSVASQILSLYPLPNQYGGSLFTDNNYNVNVPANYDSTGFDVRGDQYFGQKLSVFGRYTFKNITQLAPRKLLVPSSSEYERVRMLVLSATYSIQPTLLNEARFGFANDHYGDSNPFDGPAFASSLGLQNVGNLWFNGITNVAFSGLTTSLDVNRLFQPNQSRSIEFSDNLSWVKGRHTFKFGGDVRLVRGVSPCEFFGADNYGSFSFENTFTGDDFSDFLLGLPTTSWLDNTNHDNDGRSTHYAFFGQDSFRVSPWLTIEYGVRWEYHPAYTDANGLIGTFDRTGPAKSGRVVFPDGYASTLAPGYLVSFDACPMQDVPLTLTDPTEINGAPCTPVVPASKVGLPQSLRKMSTYILPRFGFAYKPFHNDKTVVRGGIGSYEAGTMGDIYYSLTETLNAFTHTYNNSLVGGVPLFTWPNTSSGGTGIDVGEYGSAYFGTAVETHWKDPYSLQWNLSVERDIGFSTGLRISYIGMKTTQLSWSPNWNQGLPNSTTPYQLQPLSSRPYPNWGIVNGRSIGATANYNALQIEFTRRFTGGLSFNSTYTWSKNLADNMGYTGNGGFCGEWSCSRSGNWHDRYLEYGNTYGPRRHNWISTVIYQLPVGRGNRFANAANPIVNGIIGGWQTSNIFLVQSGPFLTPLFSGGDPSGTGIGLQGRSSHPDRIGSGYPSTQSSSEWFDSSAFACPGGSCIVGTTAPGAPPPIGRYGTSGMGILEGPGTISWDFAVSKSFDLTERAKLRVEVSFTNVLNHLNLGDPDMNITHKNDPSQGLCGFGCITSAQGLFQFSGARTGQIGARIDF
jgi:hypothetical protein